MALIKCSECGEEISDKAISCPYCGVLVENEQLIKCSECGADVIFDSEFCPNCGCSIHNDEDEISYNGGNNIMYHIDGHILPGLLYIIVGVVAIVWGLSLNYNGTSTDSKTYGGDAYTGIQNASAKAANNINRLGDTVCVGLKGILIVIGGTLCIYGYSSIKKVEK